MPQIERVEPGDLITSLMDLSETAATLAFRLDDGEVHIEGWSAQAFADCAAASRSLTAAMRELELCRRPVPIVDAALFRCGR